MDAKSFMKWLGYFISAIVLVLGFLLFYGDTHEPIGSFVAAALSAILTWVSFLMLSWLVQVFLK